jgi:hypothetical protein
MELTSRQQNDETRRGMQQQFPMRWPIRSYPQRVPEESISIRDYSQRKTRIGNMVMALEMLFACLAFVVAVSVPASERIS